MMELLVECGLVRSARRQRVGSFLERRRVRGMTGANTHTFSPTEVTYLSGVFETVEGSGADNVAWE
jgi:hypothetical protein